MRGAPAVLVAAFLLQALSTAAAQGEPAAATEGTAAPPDGDARALHGTPAADLSPTAASTTVAGRTYLEERPYKGRPLVWRESWGRVGTRDFVLFGGSLSIAIGKLAIGPSFGKRRGGVLFDEEVRDALRMETRSGVRFARDVSDILLLSSVSYPFFDSLVIAGWYRNSPEVARELAWITAEAMAVTAALHGIANLAAGRERPFGRRCGDGKPAEGRDCDSNDRYYSFFSGHASQAFAAAGAVCIHHQYLPLYGGGFADDGICALGMLTAAATATLRVVGDQHYFTDVAVGAAVGTLVGMGVPWLLFYRHGPSTRSSGAPDDLTLQLLPTPNGLSVLGRFQ